MKILKDHVLLFDAQCPLCTAYSQTFVKRGLLDKNGREAFQEMKEETCIHIDKNRARNEIALVNKVNGTVYYGIESIFKIIETRYTFLKPIFAFPPFYWMMKKIYAFISYNRKVMVPGKQKQDTCIPDLHVNYRIIYLLFTWIISSVILTTYSGLLSGLIPASKFHREFIICGGQIIFQATVIRFLAKGKVLDYLGNMMTISFAASLILLLFIGFGKVFSFTNPFGYAAFFMLVVAAMLAEHVRRMKRLGIPVFASISWVIYRIIVLTIILSGL
jgi:predicted DCC family thiol-disulfide oxidoreductase YuxK